MARAAMAIVRAPMGVSKPLGINRRPYSVRRSPLPAGRTAAIGLALPPAAPTGAPDEVLVELDRHGAPGHSHQITVTRAPDDEYRSATRLVPASGTRAPPGDSVNRSRTEETPRLRGVSEAGAAGVEHAFGTASKSGIERSGHATSPAGVPQGIPLRDGLGAR
jgi:hypothetical protein